MKDLGQNQNNQPRVTEIADRLTNIVDKMHGLEFDREENNSFLIQIHTSAVNLWNLTVAMRTGATLSEALNARCKFAVSYSIGVVMFVYWKSFRKRIYVIYIKIILHSKRE